MKDYVAHVNPVTATMTVKKKSTQGGNKVAMDGFEVCNITQENRGEMGESIEGEAGKEGKGAEGVETN